MARVHFPLMTPEAVPDLKDQHGAERQTSGNMYEITAHDKDPVKDVDCTWKWCRDTLRLRWGLLLRRRMGWLLGPKRLTRQFRAILYGIFYCMRTRCDEPRLIYGLRGVPMEDCFLG